MRYWPGTQDRLPVIADAEAVDLVPVPGSLPETVPAGTVEQVRSGGDLMVALGVEALELPERNEDAPLVPRAVKVRGWAGRGPVGLRAVKVPKHLKARAETRSGLGWCLLRFATGLEWNGKVRTNARWWRSGTKAYAWDDRLPSRHAARPRATRMAVRWVSALLGLILYRLWSIAPGPTLAAVGTAVWCTLAAVGWAAADSAVGFRHRRRWVWPLHDALAPKLGYPERTPLRRYLYVPQRRDQIEIALPPDFVSDGTDDEGKQIAGIVRSKLCLNDFSEVWPMDGRNHYLIMRQRERKPMPAIVRVSNPAVKELVAAQSIAKPSAPILGLMAGGEPMAIDLDTESPHLLLSVGSGGGKSEALKGIAAQLMHPRGDELGALCSILDFKYTSHEWARYVKAARIARSIEAIHLLLYGLGQEGEARNRDAEAAAKRGGKAQFRRHILLVEEANMTITFLQLWWDTHRKRPEVQDDPERYGDPAWTKSPAVLALLGLMSMGRERNMNVILVAQHATSQALGGPAIREQFGSRILGRTPAKGWAMLAPEIQSPPVCSRRRGRMYVVFEGQVHETQTLLWGNAEAREWAVAGVAASQGCDVLGEPVRHVATPPVDTPRIVTLREAHVEGVFTTTLRAVQKATERDPEFPDPLVRAARKGEPHKYDLADLALWDQNRASRRGMNEQLVS